MIWSARGRQSGLGTEDPGEVPGIGGAEEGPEWHYAVSGAG